MQNATYIKKKKRLAQPCIAVIWLLSSRGGWIICSVTPYSALSFLQIEINAFIDTCLTRHWFIDMPAVSPYPLTSFFPLRTLRYKNYLTTDDKINKNFAPYEDMIKRIEIILNLNQRLYFLTLYCTALKFLSLVYFHLSILTKQGY